ncbi:hypothetical protein [Aquimarina longa]|uniref:hypothetical protein n=1 Tax=Aquimarina longa TaxID=1080221 RepID=UPI000784880F|nr:hypothetical protein [Aquimarina longa]
MAIKSQNTETHHFFPSGHWEGFYCYSDSPKQHKMAIELCFTNNTISGSGIDDVAPFTWKGNYNLDSFKVEMIKTYATHQISYKGDADENGIWGIWNDLTDLSKHFSPKMIENIMQSSLKLKMKGGFHIWPKKSSSNHNEAVEKQAIESEKLKEIYIEVF